MKLDGPAWYHFRSKTALLASVGAARPTGRAAVTDGLRRASGDGKALGYGSYLTAHSGARLVALKMPGSRDDTKPRGKRGRVCGFSHSSRLRMMKRIHQIERDTKPPHFVTLTFPDLFPDFVAAKKRLDTWFKRIKRRHPKTAILWRMEAVARKSGQMLGQVAPHFHLLVWGDFDLSAANLDWWQVCGEDDYAHFRHGCHTDTILAEWKGVAFYVSKYCAKASDVQCAQGRVWGTHNKAAMPLDREPVVMRLRLSEAFALARLIRRAIRGKTGTSPKCARSLYTSAPSDFLRWLALGRGVRVRPFLRWANAEISATPSVTSPLQIAV